MTNYVSVATVDEIEPGESKIVTVEGAQIALFNTGDDFHAICDECSHEGGSLGKGSLDGVEVTCPLHNWVFDVTTGECLITPADRSIQTYEVVVDGSDIKIGLSE